jgi:hypothetical protein
MNKITYIILLSLLFCGDVYALAPQNATKIRARITYYYPESPWWGRVACSKIKHGKSGVTIAAHPDFPFGTKIIIPELENKVGNGSFVVQDRGSAVTRKSAARGNGYVFDVFVPSRNTLRQLVTSTNAWMDVYILK